VGVGVDLGAEAWKIGRAAERDDHVSGDRGAAAKEFRRAIAFDRMLRSNDRDAERYRDRDAEFLHVARMYRHVEAETMGLDRDRAGGADLRPATGRAAPGHRQQCSATRMNRIVVLLTFDRSASTLASHTDSR